MFLLENNLQPGRTITGPYKRHTMLPASHKTWQTFLWDWGPGQNLTSLSLGPGARMENTDDGQCSLCFSILLICKFLLNREATYFCTARCEAAPPPSQPTCTAPLRVLQLNLCDPQRAYACPKDCVFSQTCIHYKRMSVHTNKFTLYFWNPALIYMYGKKRALMCTNAKNLETIQKFFDKKINVHTMKY